MNARHTLTPFCVADRPMSLRILRGVTIDTQRGNLGIMIHANTSKEFQRLFAEYPLERGICPYHRQRHERRQCPRVYAVRRKTIKMCDSGVFNKGGANLDYTELFQAYERSGTHYGIILDHLRNPKKTIASAKRAMSEYRRQPRKFKLVGVAQGRTVDEYVRCYQSLRRLGYRHIAIGGLLNRRKNTARYVYVRGGRLFKILEALRERYPRDWMFALGCYHPRRHEDFEQFGIFGSDYKGWIFNYEARNELGIGRARLSRIHQVRGFLERHVYSDDREPLAHRGAKDLRRRGDIAILACSKRKIWDRLDVGGTSADRAYEGTFFRLARDYMEREAHPWVILSGKHGFMNPKAVVRRTYNTRLRKSITREQTLQLRRQIIAKELYRYRRAVVLGGAEYYRATKLAFGPFAVRVVDAFPGERIGVRLNRLRSGTFSFP